MEWKGTSDWVVLLARMSALQIPEASRQILATILEKQVDDMRRLRELDLADVEFEIGFDPRWEG